MKKLSLAIAMTVICSSMFAQSHLTEALPSTAQAEPLEGMLQAALQQRPAIASTGVDISALAEKMTATPTASCTTYALPYVGISNGKQLWGVLDRFIPSTLSCYISSAEPWEFWEVPVTAGEDVTFAVESTVRTFFSIDSSVYYGSTSLQPNGKYLGGYVWHVPSSFTKSTVRVAISPYATSARYSLAVGKPVTSGSCTTTPTTVCLLNSRFRVNVSYRNHFVSPPQPGDFAAARLNTSATNPDVGIFGLNGDPKAVEIMVRLVDARPFAPRFDVYYGGLTDLEYWIIVVDTLTGTSRTYYNAPGSVGAGLDRASFPAN